MAGNELTKEAIPPLCNGAGNGLANCKNMLPLGCFSASKLMSVKVKPMVVVKSGEVEGTDHGQLWYAM